MVKSAYPYLLVASVILLFSPKLFIDNMGLSSILLEHKHIVALIFLLTLSVFIIEIIKKAYMKFATYRDHKILLSELTLEEKKFIRIYIEKGQNTQYIFPGDGIVSGLEKKGIIYRASAVGMPASMEFAYNLRPWARRFLVNNSKYLCGKTKKQDSSKDFQ